MIPLLSPITVTLLNGIKHDGVVTGLPQAGWTASDGHDRYAVKLPFGEVAVIPSMVKIRYDHPTPFTVWTRTVITAPPRKGKDRPTRCWWCSGMDAIKDIVRRHMDGLQYIGLQHVDGLRIVCDETNNTEADVQAGILNCHVFPPRPAEKIVFEGTILGEVLDCHHDRKITYD